MWQRHRWAEIKKVLQGIYGRLEDIESAPVVGVDPDRVKALESKLGAFVAELEDLAFAARLEDAVHDLKVLNDRIDHQNLAIAEGIERVTRAENRVNNTVQRARKELKKLGYVDSGLEAEDRELRLVDAERSDGGGVPEVPGAVGEADDAPSTIPGITVGQLRRARGMA